jgi:glutathione S-transferase
MLLYSNSWAPNPKRVLIYLSEKNITVPAREIDMRQNEHKREEYSAINPLQEVPALELDDGTIITESIAICRYFEELHPDPPLFGRGAQEKALIEMWQRRIELQLYAAISAVFRHLHPAMAASEHQIPAWGEANKIRVHAFLDLLDAHLARNRFVAGEQFSIADITGYVAMQFMRPAKLPWPDHIRHVTRWHGEVASRPAMAAQNRPSGA